MEHPMEVKRRIGYLPETPPVYPGNGGRRIPRSSSAISKASPPATSNAAWTKSIATCALGDVRNKLIGKLSKGYRQRVGLAQAIIHNPDVLILDEPTSGLDPKQIIEIRDLLKSLAGEHTIILSTHILPEVEHSCERVIIISRGKLVAIDSVANLTNRMRGSEAVARRSRFGRRPTESFRSAAAPGAGFGRQPRGDERLPRTAACFFEVESLQGRQIRADLARTVVNAGWNLSELAGVGIEPGRHLPATHRRALRTPMPAAEPETPAEVRK